MTNKFLIKNSINLASPTLGSKIYSYSDQFFAPASARHHLFLRCIFSSIIKHHHRSQTNKESVDRSISRLLLNCCSNPKSVRVCVCSSIL